MDISDTELNNLMNPECKMEKVKYRNLKFSIFDDNKYLDTVCEHLFWSEMVNNECKYLDVDEFLVTSDGNKYYSVEYFNTLFLNIRSLAKNLDEFVHDFSVNNLHYDILCFAETKLTADITPLFHLKDYNLFSNPRNSSGGGVAIYVSKFHSSACNWNMTVMECEIESEFVEMSIDGVQYIVGWVTGKKRTGKKHIGKKRICI